MAENDTPTAADIAWQEAHGGDPVAVEETAGAPVVIEESPEPVAVVPTEESTPAPAESDETSLVQFDGDWQVNAVVLPRLDGSKLTIDREGVRVPSTDVDAILAEAATAGFALKVGK